MQHSKACKGLQLGAGETRFIKESAGQENKGHYAQQPLQLATIVHDASMMCLTRMLIDLSSGHLHAQIMAPRYEQTEWACMM